MADTIYTISAFIALAAVITAGVRLIAGPTVADRVIALDVLTIITVSLIVYIARMSGRIIYVDVAMVYALISFVGVVAFARFLERGL
ncbi:cation:proton antiporter [bacterium]|nr:cation:proton antiporter [bacterium]